MKQKGQLILKCLIAILSALAGALGVHLSA